MLDDYILEKPVLQTERLVLRTMVKSDIASLKEWTSEKSLYKYWGKSAGKADKNVELMFAKTEKASKSFHWGIEHKADKKIVGEVWVYLIENNRMAKVAIRVSPFYASKGIATEALKNVVKFCFEKTELKRLWIDVDVENVSSIKMLEKCGFVREGLIRQGKMVSTWCNYFLYGLLKTDLI